MPERFEDSTGRVLPLNALRSTNEGCEDDNADGQEEEVDSGYGPVDEHAAPTYEAPSTVVPVASFVVCWRADVLDKNPRSLGELGTWIVSCPCLHAVCVPSAQSVELACEPTYELPSENAFRTERGDCGLQMRLRE
jgi:hypothetical protein